jgi:peptide/nickel transport system substrate-binding protein
MAPEDRTTNRGLLQREVSRRRALQLLGATAIGATAATTLSGAVAGASRRPARAGARALQQGAGTGTIRLGSYEGGLTQGLLPWNSFGQEFIWNFAGQKLISVAPDGTILYDLATAMDVSDDGLTYTFTLLDGVTFHDGTPVTAEDVAFTYNMLLKPTGGSNSSYKVATLVGADAVAADESLDAEGIKVIDDHTISFTFTEPNAGLPSGTFNTVWIVPKAAFDGMTLEQIAGSWGGEFIGSGPYRVLDYAYDQGGTLEAFADYKNASGWEGPPGAAGVAIRNFADANAQSLAAEAGELDFMYYRVPTGDILARFNSISGMHTEPSPVGFNVFYSIPYQDRPWANKDFRKALAYATDRNTMASINGAMATAADIAPWAADWATAEDLDDYTYDLDKAREHLAASGFDVSQPLDVRVFPYGVTPDEIPVLLDTWRTELGLNIQERPFTNDGFIKEFYEDFDYDIGFVYGFGTLDGQPFGAGSQLLSDQKYPAGFNGTAFANQAFDDAYVAGVAAPTQEEQAPHFQEATRIFNDELPYFPYFDRVDVAVVSDRMSGYENTQMYHPAAGGVEYWAWAISE